jgi:hypothetical protein
VSSRIAGILRNIRRDAHFEGLARTSAENQTTVPPEGDRNMSAPTERADPDLQLQAAWLAQVSDPTEASVSEQAPRQSGHSPRASTDSLEPVDRATEQHVALPLGSVLRRRSGLVMISLIGFILALALPLVIGIPQLPETWREPAGGHTIGLGTSEPLTSAIPGVRDELESPPASFFLERRGRGGNSFDFHHQQVPERFFPTWQITPFGNPSRVGTVKIVGCSPSSCE